MASKTVQVECFILIDEDGDYAAGKDRDQAIEGYDNEYSGSGARRMVKVVLTVPLPAPIVLTGTVPEEATEGAALCVAE